VSRLGKIFRISFLPLSSERVSIPRSDFTSENSGALLPVDGRFPEVFTGLPLNAVFAIVFFQN
jgi:hypothetical protein